MPVGGVVLSILRRRLPSPRAFCEAMLAAGAREVYLLVDHPPPTTHQVADFQCVLG